MRDPPPAPGEGTLWGIGAGATGVWAGQDGRMAIFLGGGWSVRRPLDRLAPVGGGDGTRLAQWPGGLGAGGRRRRARAARRTLIAMAETDHVLSPGPSSTTGPVIPDKAVVMGVNGAGARPDRRATGWQLGVAGAPERYGSGFGTAAGAFAEGVTGQPQAYYGGTALLLTALGGRLHPRDGAPRRPLSRPCRRRPDTSALHPAPPPDPLMGP